MIPFCIINDDACTPQLLGRAWVWQLEKQCWAWQETCQLLNEVINDLLSMQILNVRVFLFFFFLWKYLGRKKLFAIYHSGRKNSERGHTVRNNRVMAKMLCAFNRKIKIKPPSEIPLVPHPLHITLEADNFIFVYMDSLDFRILSCRPGPAA